MLRNQADPAGDRPERNATIPVVSVVMPTARRPKLVVRAVGAVLGQTVAEIEVIVVVDGPDPATSSALAALTDSRLRVVQNPTSGGPVVARNAGAAAATGRWLAFLDDDDEWMPEKLELQLRAALAAPDQDRVLVSCLSRVVTPRGQYEWPRRIYDNRMPIDEYLFDRRSLFRGDAFLQTSSFFLSRTLFDKLKFAPHFPAAWHEDWDLALRAVKEEGAQIITVPKPLVVHYAEERRPSLSNLEVSGWRASLRWLDERRHLIGPRAAAGFCLTVLAGPPAERRDFRAFGALLWRAFARGRPTVTQLAVFLAFWASTGPLRRAIRAVRYRGN
jgi:glycosyltransferase involved in cell wall biosynthesis